MSRFFLLSDQCFTPFGVDPHGGTDGDDGDSQTRRQTEASQPAELLLPGVAFHNRLQKRCAEFFLLFVGLVDQRQRQIQVASIKRRLRIVEPRFLQASGSSLILRPLFQCRFESKSSPAELGVLAILSANSQTLSSAISEFDTLFMRKVLAQSGLELRHGLVSIRRFRCDRLSRYTE